MPKHPVLVRGVNVIPNGEKLNKIPDKKYSGKTLLLSPDENLIIAWSNQQKSLSQFVRKNKLKGYVFAVILKPGTKFIF